jgi:predicted nucleic acid-binding protein
MNVLVDSTIWSLALRRKVSSAPEVLVWRELVRRGRARILGPVRQEVLSGIREPARYEKLRDALRAFPDISLTSLHYERAAEISNLCRAHGVQGSATDFLICATSELENLSILTTDRDFRHYARFVPLTFH